MKLEEKQKFFAYRQKTTTIRMDGKKLAFANLPTDVRNKVLDRLAEKDNVMKKGQAGILPGIKIDGREVTRDNIHEFEKKSKVEESSPAEHIETPEEVVQKKIYTKENLETISFKKLKVIGKKFGTTDRSKTNLIKEILKLQ